MKPFTIYFPQFHASETNNKAWGVGFSDWALVAYANLTSQWERRAPDKGFYDGASATVQDQQICEMKAYGLGGMGLYHYWFDGHRELNWMEDRCRNGNVNFPWFSIWANEAWTKRWIGDSSLIIDLSSSPSIATIKQHCIYLAESFSSPEYLHVDNKPLFVFYNAGYFANPAQVVGRYRSIFARLGYNVALGQFVKNPSDFIHSKHFDINYCFEPRLFFGMKRLGRNKNAKLAFDALRRVLPRGIVEKFMIVLDRFQQKGISYSSDTFIEYFFSSDREILMKNYTFQEVLSPGWNNYPRYGNQYTQLNNLDPREFSGLVRQKSIGVKYPVLINAWNEWSEGAAIEPCYYKGDIYLREIKEILNGI